MNPIANLPATQNLNRPQQSQGYNRQYFGGDEVDQFELSQEAEEAAAEEQNKKKIWAYAAGIGAAIVAGAAVLLGLRATGHATWAKLGNNENSLTGLTKLSKTQGDTVKKGATLAEGAMKGTLSGGSWNGISTSITGSASQYNNIIFIGKKENFDALKEKITDSAVNGKLQHMAYETFEKLKDSINTYLNDDKAAIIVDTDLRNADGGSVYERIKKYWDESNSAGGETKAEEKKEEVTTTETDGGTGSVKDTTQDEAAKVKARKEEVQKFIKAKSGSLQLTDDEMKLLDDSKTVTLGGITYHMGTKVENPTDGMNNTKRPNTLVYDNEKLYITRKDGDAINFYQILSQTEFDKAKEEAEAAEKAAAEKAAAEKAAAEKAAAEKTAAEKTAAVINQPANKNAGVDDLLKVNPQKTAEIPESEQQDNSQTSVVAADEKTKVVDSTTTGTTVGGQQNTNVKPADKPADNPVDSSNANENAADSNPPIATGAATGAPADGQPAATGTTVDGQQAVNTVTGNTGGTSEGGKQTVDEHPVVTPASTVQDGGSNPKLDKTKESTPNTAVQNPAANENQNQGGNTGAGAGTNTTDQSNPSANETKATNPSNPAAKESSDSEVDEVENNTKK